MTLLTRILRAAAALAGLDTSGDEKALTIERDNLLAQLAQCRQERRDEAARHEAVVKELEADNARLRALAAAGDPVELLNSLPGP